MSTYKNIHEHSRLRTCLCITPRPDFVLAFLAPVSKKRNEHLQKRTWTFTISYVSLYTPPPRFCPCSSGAYPKKKMGTYKNIHEHLRFRTCLCIPPPPRSCPYNSGTCIHKKKMSTWKNMNEHSRLCMCLCMSPSPKMLSLQFWYLFEKKLSTCLIYL